MAVHRFNYAEIYGFAPEHLSAALQRKEKNLGTVPLTVTKQSVCCSIVHLSCLHVLQLHAASNMYQVSEWAARGHTSANAQPCVCHDVKTSICPQTQRRGLSFHRGQKLSL